MSIFDFTPQAVALLWTCPLIAGIASLVRGWTSELDLMQPPAYQSVGVSEPHTKRKQTKENRRIRGYWVVGILLAGAGIGFGIALLFLGAIQPTAGAVGRVWFLSLVLGYAAPIVLRKVDSRVAQALNQTNE